MKKTLRAAFWALTIAYWITIFTVTHIPIQHVPGPHVNDKAAHGVAYLVLGALLFLSGCFLSARRWVVAAWALAICLVYGAIDELLQGFVNRSPELADWLADALGALTGVSLGLAAHVIARRPSGEPLP